MAKLWAVLSPLTKILMVAALFVKLHLLASVLKCQMYAVRDSFSFCCNLHKVRYGSVNIRVTNF